MDKGHVSNRFKERIVTRSIFYEGTELQTVQLAHVIFPMSGNFPGLMEYSFVFQLMEENLKNLLSDAEWQSIMGNGDTGKSRINIRIVYAAIICKTVT